MDRRAKTRNSAAHDLVEEAVDKQLTKEGDLKKYTNQISDSVGQHVGMVEEMKRERGNASWAAG